MHFGGQTGSIVAANRLRAATGVVDAIYSVSACPGWCGSRRNATDLAESATTDDCVKDRLGVWQDSATRQQICLDRQTDELRAGAAKVRRALRLGAKAEANGSTSSLDLDALLVALTPGQRA